MSSFSDDLFWNDVSGEHERFTRQSALTHAKVKAAAYWPFLSSAYSERDFENRLNLSLPRLTALVGSDTLEAVCQGLRDDYRLVTTAGEKNVWGSDKDDVDKEEYCKDCEHSIPGHYTNCPQHRNSASKVAEKGGKPWDTDKSDDAKKESDDAKDQAEDETGTDNSSDKSDKDDDDSSDTQSSKGKSKSDDDGDDKSKGNQPNWLSDKQKDDSTNDRDKKGDTKKSAASSPWDIGKPCTSCGADPVVKKKRDGSVSQTTTHDADCKMMARTFGRESAYQPDPTASQRYYAPYESLESLPLNNGDLQGPDGFIEDLAQGEQRTPEAYARQTTPGTWTQGEGMPERPMPQGVARGYQPVAARSNDPAEHPDPSVRASHHWQTGYDDGSDPQSYNTNNRMQNYQAFYGETAHKHYMNGLNTGRKDRKTQMQSESSYIDKEGFLVESVVDPVPGAPLASNPFYFSTDSQGLVGDGFPQSPQPQADAEAMNDRANTYGDVQPQMSSGSQEGQIDGDGYSRSHPGTQARRNFNVESADHFNRGHYDAEKGRNYQGEENQDTHEARTYREGWNAFHNPSGHASDDRATQKTLFGHTGSTDGLIVNHCPGCKKPRRIHSTAHGDEVRHLHNNHVRCHGSKQAGIGEALEEGAVEGSGHPGLPGLGGGGHEETNQSATDTGTPDKGSDTWAWDSLHANSALSWGPNIGGHDHSLSFAEALAYNSDYGTMNSSLPQFISADYVSRPDALDPTGRGDDWSARTWDAGANTRPMQSHEDRAVNTPVRPQAPLETRNIGPENPQFDRSRTDHIQQSDDEDED